MNFTKLLKIFSLVNFRNKINLFFFSLFSIIFKLTGKRVKEKIKIQICDTVYGINIGKGELNTIYYTNILRNYMTVDGFVPLSNAVCVDVGANIGSTALAWAKTINGGKIFAFEPHPEAFNSLMENIRLNKTEKTILPRQIAIGAIDGNMNLYVSDFGTMAMQHNHYNWDCKRITVPLMSIDTFVKKEKIASIDILKIDIEGFEAEALMGAVESLNKTKRVVLEYHSSELRKKCIEILDQFGFNILEKDSLIFGLKN
jgi:FkbM family methyltransferase